MSISLWYFAFLILSRAMINFRCYQVSLLCLWTFWILFPGNTIDGCTLPSTLTTSDWVYTKSGSPTTVSFSQDNIMTGISYNARGSILNSYKCILNTMNVYVFKSTKSYSEFGITRWLYLCMKLTKVSDNLFYFYLLADVDTDLGDRVLAPPAAISDTDPTCDYCQYTTPPADNEIRTLQRKDTQETLPGGESPCLPCDAVCSTTEALLTSTVSELTSGETTTTSGETTTEENSDGCTLPSTLTTSDWVYTKSGSSTTVSFSQYNIMTGISYNARGSILNSYKCILNTLNVYVFKSTKSYSEFGVTRWLYLCMKLTKVSDNLFYFYLLADVDTGLGDRVLAPSGAISDTDPTCDYCQYTTPPSDNEIRTLQRKDTQETLPGGESPCLPCDAVCKSSEALTASTVPESTSGETTTEENSGCKLPGSLIGDWYDVKKNVNVTFTPTKLINWPVVLTGSLHKDQTCIYNTNNVYVFRGDDKYDVFINFYYYYFCMKLTKVSDNLYYYYLLSDTDDPIANGERTYLPEDSGLPNDTCGYCRYTTEIPADDYRLLQKIGTNESPSESPTPCLPCEATCDLTTESIFASSTTESLNDVTSHPGSTDKDTTILTSSTTERLNDVTSQSGSTEKAMTILTSSTRESSNDVTSQSGSTDKGTSNFASSTTESSKSVTSQSGSTDKDTMTYFSSNYISTDGFQYSSTADKPTTTYTSVVITSQNEDTSVIDTTIVKTSLDASSTSDGRTSSKLSTTSTATTTLSVLQTTTKNNDNTNGAGTFRQKSNMIGSLTDATVLLIVSCSLSGIFLGLTIITLGLCCMRKGPKPVKQIQSRPGRQRRERDYNYPFA